MGGNLRIVSSKSFSLNSLVALARGSIVKENMRAEWYAVKILRTFGTASHLIQNHQLKLAAKLLNPFRILP